jgi:hypothetical protein
MSTSMPELPKTNEGKRICQVIKVKPEALEEYKKVDTLYTEEMIGLIDSVMPLYGPRYWRHYVKLMLSVSCQAISSFLERSKSSILCEKRGRGVLTRMKKREESKGQMDRGTEQGYELMIDYSIHFLEQEHLLIAHMR